MLLSTRTVFVSFHSDLIPGESSVQNLQCSELLVKLRQMATSAFNYIRGLRWDPPLHCNHIVSAFEGALLRSAPNWGSQKILSEDGGSDGFGRENGDEGNYEDTHGLLMMS